MRIPAACCPPVPGVGCVSSLSSSLLKPFGAPPTVKQAPSPDPAGRAVKSDGPGTVQISVAGDVHNPAVQVSIDVVRRTVRHEQDLVRDPAPGDVLIKIDGSGRASESVRYGCRSIRQTGQDLKIDVDGQGDGGDLRGCGQGGAGVPAEYLDAPRGRRDRRN